MAIKVYGSLAVLSARIAPTGGGPLMKDAHRHTFDYEPTPGFLYVRSRAISSRTNDNFDTFPAEEIRKAWASFKGKPVFVNHHNDNHKRARGVIVDAALHEDTNPDGTPDTWVEVLMEVDAVRFPKLAEAVMKGHIDRTSMGTDVAFSVCSFCGNKASTPLEYCAHIPRMKGKRIERRTASGTRESVLVHEICYGLGFFENSLLVEDPADPTAFTFGVDARGLGVTASKTAGGPRDTPASAFGLVWKDGADKSPDVLAAKGWSGWDSLPTTQFSLGKPLHATEPLLASSSINKVVSGGEAFRSGYDPHILVDHNGDAYVIDGHHRAAMHTLLHHPGMGAKVLDLRTHQMQGAARRYGVEFDCGHVLDMIGTSTNFLPKVGDSSECSEHGPVHVVAIHGNEAPNDPYTQEGRSPRRRSASALAIAEAALLMEAMPVAAPTPLTRGVPKKPKYKNPGDHPGFKTLQVSPENVEWHWDHATPEEKAHGMRWYEDAHHMANLMGAGNSDVTAGILSAYSPQASWPQNMLNAARTIRTGKAVGPGQGAMRMHQKAAERILNGEHWSNVLTAPKTYAFAHLIATGGKDPDTGASLDDVVIDRHALSVAAGRRVTDNPKDERASRVLKNPLYYGHVADAYREAAKRISEKEGHEVAPYQVQAATWLTRQRLNEDEQRKLGELNDRMLRGRNTAQENAYHKWQGEETEQWPGGLAGNMHAASLREAMMCSECNPNYGFPDQLCSSHASMRKLQTQWGDWSIGDFQSGADSTDILFPGRRTAQDVGTAVTPAADMSGLSPSQQAAGGFCHRCGIWFFGHEHHLHNHHEHEHAHHHGVWMQHCALGEQKAPQQIDTLRDDTCPVCGEEDGFNGDTCQVCGYVQPPKQFQDPDVDKAKQIDLRGGDVDGADQGTTLQCDQCGATFETGGTAHAKTTFGEDGPQDPTADDEAVPGTETQDDNPDQAPPDQNASVPDDSDDNADDSDDEDDDEEDDEEDDDNAPPWKKKKSAFRLLLAAFPDPNGKNLPVPGPASPANEPASNNAAKSDKPGEDPAKGNPGEDGGDDTDEAHLQVGDTCPQCNQGVLVEADQEDDEDDLEDEDINNTPDPGATDNSADQTSLADKAQGMTARRNRSREMPNDPNDAARARNALIAALREQQAWLTDLDGRYSRIEAALTRVATLAGVEKEPVFAALRSQSDLGNAADAAAGKPPATDSPTNPGAAPAAANTGVTPAATTDLSNSNVAQPTEPFANLVDVTQPEPGTDNVPSPSDAQINTEVRVGNPDNNTTAFPIGGEGSGWTAASKHGEDPQERFMASLNLARLRAQAGLTSQGDLELSQEINDNVDLSLADINTEAATLDRVLTQGGRQQQAQATRRPVVPSRTATRQAPSLAAQGGVQPAAPVNHNLVQPEEFLFG